MSIDPDWWEEFKASLREAFHTPKDEPEEDDGPDWWDKAGAWLREQAKDDFENITPPGHLDPDAVRGVGSNFGGSS